MSWPKLQLGEISSLERRSLVPEAIKTGTNYLGLEHIESGGRILVYKKVEAGELKSNKFIFDPGTLLYGKLRPYLAKVCIPDREGCCSTDILPIRPGKHLDIGYLRHLLLWKPYVDQAASLCSGANLPRISPSALLGIEIPLPPLEEQRRIAAILDKRHFLEDKIRRRGSLQEDLWKAEFVKQFGNPFAHQSRYPLAKIAEIASTSSGGTPSRKVRSYFGGSIPWVKSGELSSPIVETTEEFLTEDGLGNSSAKILNPGVVLLAMYGATAGAVSILGLPASTNQAICAIDAHGRLDSIYLADYLRLIAPALLAKRIGGAQPNLTQDIIRNILIPVPDEAAQGSYISFRKQMANVAAGFSCSLMAVSRLGASFSRKAFALDSGL